MEFQTAYNRTYPSTEKVAPPDEPDLIDRAGYRTVEEQVNELMRAGERLADYRRHSEFQNLDDIPTDYLGDPTRRSDFDLVDIAPMSEAIKRNADQERKKRQEDDEKNKADEKEAKIREAKDFLAEAEKLKANQLNDQNKNEMNK